MNIAEIFINQKCKGIDKTYDYLIPVHLAQNVVPGVRVVVSFNSEKRRTEGFVVACESTTAFFNQLKPILEVLDPVPILTARQIELCRWMKERYFSLFYDALSNFTLPVKVTRKTSEEGLAQYKVNHAVEKRYALTEAGRNAATKGKQAQRILTLLHYRQCTAAEMRACLGNVSAARRSLEKKGWVKAIETDVCSETPRKIRMPDIRLNEQSKKYYREYRSKLRLNLPVTVCDGDQRTRFVFYCQIAADCLKRGQQVVICFPEVSMTLSLKEQFFHYFGNSCALCHSKMSSKERRQIFDDVQKGKIRVVLGTRAALFLPFNNLGAIMIDRASDETFSAVSMPYYATFETARHYAELCHCPMITGDTIPSMTEYVLHQRKKQIILASSTQSCPIEAADMQREIKSGNFDFMSRDLKTATEAAVTEGKRCILMLNLRRYASQILCRLCGTVAKCKRCDIPMQVTADQQLICPYCGDHQPLPERCPECGESHFRPIGLGLEQVHQILEQRYPQWRILRIDGGTIQNDQDFEQMNHWMIQGDWDVMLGTQMVLKGFDYPEIALAGALLMDCDLHADEYDASEKAYRFYNRFFALAKNRAIAQTYDKENIVVTALTHGDLHMFYRGEMDYRKVFYYPPFGHLIYFYLSHSEKEIAEQDAMLLFDALQLIVEATVFTPIYSGFQRKNKKHQYRIIAKTQQLNAFHEKYQKIEQQFYKEREKNGMKSSLSISLDISISN